MPPSRVGLVLGAGGVVGAAFHAGVLCAVAEATGFDPREAEVIVGTSAGSLTGALLRGGFPARDLAARALGKTLSGQGVRVLERLGPLPDPPSLEFGSFGRGSAAPSALLWAGLRPWSVRPGAVVAAMLPEGRTPSDPLRRLLEPLFDDGWARDPFWVCAVRLSDARRMVFGRDDPPGVTLGQAVAASCAIPGVFEPVPIGPARYVDGGAHSPTNLDVVARAGLDLVMVSSPMSAAGRGWRLSPDLPFRRLCRATLAREAISVRRRGTRVLVFQPTVEDQRVMGLNPMDPERRAPVVARVRESTLRRLQQPDVRRQLGSIGLAPDR